MRRFPLIGLLLLVCIVAAGCSSPQFNIVGSWKDATGKVQTYSKDGTCQNVSVTSYYDSKSSKSKYSLSNVTDKDGLFTLSVSEANYVTTKFNVKVINNNEIELYFSDKNVPLYSNVAVYKLKRQ